MRGAPRNRSAAIGCAVALALASSSYADTIVVRKHAPGIAPDQFRESITGACERDWGANAVLSEYCERKNLSALREISFLLNSFDLDSSVKDAVRACMEEWRDGEGYNWHMAQYCFDTRSEPLRR